MRKLNVFLSMLVLMALLLAACGAEETGTVVPNTEPPALTEEPLATETPVATETVVSGEQTATAGIPVTGENNPSRLSNQLNFDVWNQNGEQVGEVNDMILDLDNTRVAYVIVGTGGFLEIGEKDVLVPWNLLQVQTAGSGGPADDENAFILQADQEVFENAPDVDISATLPGRGEPAGDWDVDIRTYWETGALPATALPEATVAADATATVSPDATAEATEVPGAVELQGVVLASDVLGSAVTLMGQAEVQGQEQATATPDTAQATATVDPAAATATIVPNAADFNGVIEDMIVDIDAGDILYVVVNAAFDEGDRWIPVPLRFFQWDASNDTFVIDADPVMVQEAPFFEDDTWPDTTVETWDDEFNAFWQ
ncbi:MAG TPA: PRC-barrel domain-containing protein [Anaerolineales bacterium]|nr:PRC-barrel domain-containing protein [Anaerolineales bacterium]